MKNSYKLLSILLTLMLALGSANIIAFAEDELLTDESSEDSVSTELMAESEEVLTGEGAVSDEEATFNFSGEISELKADISWSGELGSAVAHAIRIWPAGQEFTEETTVFEATDLTAAKCEVKLASGAEFCYQLGVKDGADNVSWGEVKTFSTPKLNPVTVSSVVVKSPSKDNLTTISWKSNGTVSKYAIVRVSKSGSKHILSTDTKVSAAATSRQFRASAGSYKYAVRSYDAKYPGVYVDSNEVDTTNGNKVVKVKAFVSKVHKSFTWTVTTKKSTTLYKNSTGSAKIKTLKKGVKSTAIGKHPKLIKGWNKPSRIKVKLSNGQQGWIAYGALSWHANVCVSKDYPLSVKLDFVNNYSSSTNYLVWVNQYTERVSVFKRSNGKWSQVRTFRCNVGSFIQPVNYGSKFSLGKRRGTIYRLDERGRQYYFRLARGFHGGGYFHTRCKWMSGKWRNGIARTPSTRGCIRLYDKDASYIYNLPTGSKVVIR